MFPFMPVLFLTDFSSLIYDENTLQNCLELCLVTKKKCFVLGLEALNKFDFLPDVETPAPSRLGRDAQQVGDISRKKLNCLPLPNRS